MAKFDSINTPALLFRQALSGILRIPDVLGQAINCRFYLWYRGAHPLHSFLNSKMSTGLPELVSGQPGLLLVALSAKTVFHVFASRSAEAKVEALRKLLIKTKEAHREALYDLLPTLPPSHAKDPAFDCLSMRSFFLNRLDGHSSLIGRNHLTSASNSMSSRLTQLENKVASAGLWRWSPVYLGREILVISGELETLHENTLVRSLSSRHQ